MACCCMTLQVYGPPGSRGRAGSLEDRDRPSSVRSVLLLPTLRPGVGASSWFNSLGFFSICQWDAVIPCRPSRQQRTQGLCLFAGSARTHGTGVSIVCLMKQALHYASLVGQHGVVQFLLQLGLLRLSNLTTQMPLSIVLIITALPRYTWRARKTMFFAHCCYCRSGLISMPKVLCRGNHSSHRRFRWKYTVTS